MQFTDLAKRWQLFGAGMLGLILLATGMLVISVFTHHPAAKALAASPQAGICHPDQTNTVRGQVQAATATSITLQCAQPMSAFGNLDFTPDNNPPLVITLNNHTRYQMFPGAQTTMQPLNVNLYKQNVTIVVMPDGDRLTATLVTLISSPKPSHW